MLENCQSISLTSVVVKLLESLIHNRMNHFIAKH